MRARLAAISADRISRAVVLIGGLLCGALVFFVGLPLARSNPYPTAREAGSIILHAPFAAASAQPPALDPQPPTAIEAQAAIEWEALLAPIGVFAEPLAMVAIRIPDPIWPVDPGLETEASPGQGVDLGSTEPGLAPPDTHAGTTDEIDDYLWEVYQRAPIKRDSSGDFTWKDIAAADRLGMTLRDYVIGGMHPDFREQLYHAGKAMDATGIRWSILSAFRDDWRQGIASGFKAHGGNSLHGGSRATGGYGHGRAIDVTSADGTNDSEVWRWLDTHGAIYGLRRPMPGADPAHIQPRDGARNIVLALRTSRVKDRPARVAAQQKAAGHRTRYAKAAAHHHGQRRS